MNSISQDLIIELKSQGRNTIPVIGSGNIVTIHGNNGVGKSMAATLLEIASGNYIFENETRFQKLANVIESCEIHFKNKGNLLFKVILKPHLWRFDKNLNRVNPLTLGKFFKGELKREKAIDFDEFRQNINIRTIRGSESLQQQISFFKDVFVAKISQKLKKLEKKIEFLEKYHERLNKNEIENKINDYTKLQQNYNGQLNRISNLNNSIKNREVNLKNLEKKTNLLNKLMFIGNNDLETLIKERTKEEKNVENTKKTIEVNYKELSTIGPKLEELETHFDKKTKEILKELTMFRNKKEHLKTQLNSQLDFKLEHLEERKGKKQLAEIKSSIGQYQDKIKKYKESIERLNKENERIIEINKFLTQLRDICSKASSLDFGKEKLIKATINEKTDSIFSFEELFEIFSKNNIIFKQDKELKEYQSKVLKFNEKIQKNRKIFDILTEYNKILEKITLLEKEIKGKSSKLDNFIDLETRLENLKEKQQDKKNIIENLEKDILEYNRNIEQLTKIIEEVKDIPSQTSIINDLNKLGIKIDRKESIVENCKQNISKVEKEFVESDKELSQMNQEKEITEKNIKKSKDDLDNIIQKIRIAAKQFGYARVGKFIAYLKPHIDKFKTYLENTNKLHTRLKILKDDIEKVIEGVKPKNKAHLEIINNQFDDIFKKVYDRKEFFEFVFTDYSKIKQFDIGNKTIIFETVEGLEETRDLEEFSSGEKTYAYCRSIISMTANIAKYNIVILDESYALLDHEHSQNLYQFQEQMIQQNGITKFINILPLKENLNGLITIVKKNLEEEEKKKEESQTIRFLKSQLDILQSFQNDVSTKGYYQEIHYPKENRKELKVNFGTIQSIDKSLGDEDFLEEELAFSFILDGSNIARNNRNTKNASIRDVVKCKKKLQKMGIPEKNILIIFGAGLRHYIPTRDKELYESLLRERTNSQAPAGRDDDWFIIQYAYNHNSYIITNDRYLEYREKSLNYKHFIDFHSIRYSVIGNDIIFEEGFKDKLKTIIAKNNNII